MNAAFLIVGAGMTGAVLARRIAETLDAPVEVIDRRPHMGGNCWSEIDAPSGVECHRYGSHIFHTSNQAAWDFASRFTAWNDYRHTVWTSFRQRVYPMPINLMTINALYGRNFTPEDARAFIRAEVAKEGVTTPSNLEEKAISLVGRPLYEAFIRGYTMKQWEKDPRELAPEIITRLPVRYTYNLRYFADTWEGIPLDGYAALFRRMLDHPCIRLRLGVDWRDIREGVPATARVIFTGPMDSFFDWRLGRLEWRTLDFEIDRPECADAQGCPVMNFADIETRCTRAHEFKHYHPERPDTGKTVIWREYSRFAGRDDEPYYPVDTAPNRKLLAAYQELARRECPNVTFAGRLGAYRYLDMDDAIVEALEVFATITGNNADTGAPRHGQGDA